MFVCDRFSLCAKYHASLHAFTPRYSVHICNVFVCNLYSWCVRQVHVDGTYCIRVYKFRRMKKYGEDASRMLWRWVMPHAGCPPPATQMQIRFGSASGGSGVAIRHLVFTMCAILRTWAYVVCGRDKNTYVRAMFTKIVNSWKNIKYCAGRSENRRGTAFVMWGDKTISGKIDTHPRNALDIHYEFNSGNYCVLLPVKMKKKKYIYRIIE